jgi:hypothetical protein
MCGSANVRLVSGLDFHVECANCGNASAEMFDRPGQAAGFWNDYPRREDVERAARRARRLQGALAALIGTKDREVLLQLQAALLALPETGSAARYWLPAVGTLIEDLNEAETERVD